MKWFLLAFALAGCSSASPDAGHGETREPAPEPASPTDGETRAPSPSPAPPVAPDGGTCAPGALVSYAVGKRCGPFAVGTFTCPGQPVVEGVVYGCEDEGGEPRRPNVNGCRAWSRWEGHTFTLCPEAACQRFEDARCAGTAWACSSDRLGVPGVLPSGAASCGSLGGWEIGNTSGPLFCCP